MKINRTYKFTSQVSFIKWNKFFLDSTLFILLAAFNGLIPICICLIAAAFNPFGTQLTMAIGYITAIQLGFVQFSWTICLATIFAYNRYQRKKVDGKQMEVDLVSSTIALTIVYGLLVTPLFLGISFAYNNYASAHINTLLGQAQANNYIWGISGYILLSGFIHAGIIFIQKYKSNLCAVLLLILFVALALGISAGLTLGTRDLFVITKSVNGKNVLDIKPGNFQGLFLGLGFTIASVIMLPIIHFSLVKCTNFRLRNVFSKAKVCYFLKRTYAPLFVILTIQIIKAVMIIAIGLILTESVAQVVPVSYQLARNVWYNLLYLLPFFAYGMADAVLYYGATIKYINREDFKKLVVITSLLVLAVQIPLIAAIYYAIEPLAAFYLKYNLDVNGLSWGMDTSKVSIKYTLETLLKKQEYVDKIKLLSTPAAIEQALVGFGIDPTIAKRLAPILVLPLKGLTSDDLTIRENSINAIVQLVHKNPLLEQMLKQKFAAFLNNGKSTSVFKMFDVSQNSYAYIYVSVWCLTYPIGQIFNYSAISLKRSFNKFSKVFIVFLLQASIISFIVAFGIEMQYSKEFPMYDAWSLPLMIFGPISLAYFGYNFLKQTKK